MTLQVNESFVRGALGTKKMTMEDLAAQMGVSRQTIYNMLAGESFNTTHLKKLAEVLDTTPSRLLDPREAVVS